MRKYKQVKEKKVTFDMNEWAEVERRAAAAGMKTGTYIKKIAVNGELTYYDMQQTAPLVNANLKFGLVIKSVRGSCKSSRRRRSSSGLW